MFQYSSLRVFRVIRRDEGLLLEFPRGCRHLNTSPKPAVHENSARLFWDIVINGFCVGGLRA